MRSNSNGMPAALKGDWLYRHYICGLRAPSAEKCSALGQDKTQRPYATLRR